MTAQGWVQPQKLDASLQRFVATVGKTSDEYRTLDEYTSQVINKGFDRLIAEEVRSPLRSAVAHKPLVYTFFAFVGKENPPPMYVNYEIENYFFITHYSHHLFRLSGSKIK